MAGPPNERHDPRPQVGLDESPWMTILSAVLFLYVGFWLGMRGISGHALYDGSVAAFTWMGRIVGIGLLIVAGMAFVRLPAAGTLNLVMSGIAAAGCLGVGAIWLAYGDMQGLLVLLFGILNASAARGAWQSFRRA